jgi:uncharacterized protein YndB with AHSA1/START domain
MGTALRITLPLVGVALAALALWIRTRPDRIHVERAATIAAPSDAVFAYLNDFHRWAEWSPFESDPAMERRFEGAPAGVGAVYRWRGDRQVGAGSSTIVASEPGRRVQMALEFLAPMRASHVATFTLTPAGSGTRVSWALDGAATPTSKLMSLVMDMDGMCGAQFEKGLATLKALVERPATASAARTATHHEGVM